MPPTAPPTAPRPMRVFCEADGTQTVVRARTAQEAAGLVHEERGAAATTAYCVEVAPGQWERVRIERARPAKGRE